MFRLIRSCRLLASAAACAALGLGCARPVPAAVPRESGLSSTECRRGREAALALEAAASRAAPETRATAYRRAGDAWGSLWLAFADLPDGKGEACVRAGQLTLDAARAYLNAGDIVRGVSTLSDLVDAPGKDREPDLADAY